VGYAVCDDAQWFNAKVAEDWQAAEAPLAAVAGGDWR
jgi:hypothetical protein